MYPVPVIIRYISSLHGEIRRKTVIAKEVEKNGQPFNFQKASERPSGKRQSKMCPCSWRS